MKAMGPVAFFTETTPTMLLQGAERLGGEEGEELSDFAYDLATIQNLPEREQVPA